MATVGGELQDGMRKHPLGDIFRIFLRLGLTSFGGPIAHLGYFRAEFVERRKWLDDHAFVDLVALCQFTPGATSSKVGMGIGLMAGGLPGACAAWLGFTTPSALAMVAFAYGVTEGGGVIGPGVVHGLKVVAVAVVALAVWGMARTLCPDAKRAGLAVGAALVFLAWPGPAGQVAAIVAAGLIGWRFLPATAPTGEAVLHGGVGRGVGAAALALFFALLLGLPLVVALTQAHVLAMFDAFYRSGALVFGGGHVVLPLLRAEVVPPHWVTDNDFLAGYGAAQAVPGPLFTFSAYLGAVMGPEPNGWRGALVGLAGLFLPSFLLVVGALPFWETLRRRMAVRAALAGINAAVVGLLLAALYDPVWVSAIHDRADFALALAAFAALAVAKLPPWIVVVATAAGGWALGALAT